MNFLEIDNSIGFVGIPNKFGKKIVAEYSKGLVQLLTEYELELYAIESVLRMNTRRDMKTNLDKPIYSLTLYKKSKTSDNIVKGSYIYFYHSILTSCLDIVCF